MKFFILFLSLMTTVNALSQDGKAITVKKTFSRETTVQIKINADAAIIWALLTNGSDMTRWNSTIRYFEGDIAEGNTVKLKSVLDEKRVFKLKVKFFDPEKCLIWGDGKGNRIFTITANEDETCTFNMTEKIGGFTFPMYAKYIPPFDSSFEQFALDLKKEAELIYHSKN